MIAAGVAALVVLLRFHAGNAVTETAKVIQAQFAGPTGYWIAQWPDMTYPVRAELRLEQGALISETRFNEPSDPARYGSVEHAVLSRILPR